VLATGDPSLTTAFSETLRGGVGLDSAGGSGGDIVEQSSGCRWNISLRKISQKDLNLNSNLIVLCDKLCDVEYTMRNHGL
jgi:hypothetical protein